MKHAGSRSPFSWLQENISITNEEAIARVEEYRKDITGEQSSFAELTFRVYDCSKAKHGGDLELIGLGLIK